jgi:hypothetical protein
MEPFDSIEKLINKRGSPKILLQRLELAKDQYAALERKVTELSTEVHRLRHENELLLQKAQKSSVPDEFVRHNGVLWRRSGAGFDAAPYCPKCKIVMFEFPPRAHMFWNCSGCQMTAGWHPPPPPPGA